MKCLTRTTARFATTTVARATFPAALLAMALTLAMMAPPAHATGSHPTMPPPATQPSAVSLAGSASKASALSLSGSHSKSQSASASSAKQHQAQNQSQTLKNSGNSRATAVGGVSYATGGTAQTGPVTTSAQSEGSIVSVGGDHYEAAHIPVNTAYATVANTTAECHYHNGGGGQGSALGLSISIGRKDGDCQAFMLAQFFYGRGLDAQGDAMLCQIKQIRTALGKECLALVGVRRDSQEQDFDMHTEDHVVDPRLLKKRAFESINK